MANAVVEADFPVNTGALVTDYVRYRVRTRRQAVPLEVEQGLNERVGLVQLELRRLAKEIENKYAEQFNGICDSFHLQPSTANSTFTGVVNSLFVPGGINWGRVVSLFVFSGALAEQCVQKEMPFLVDQIIDWTITYADRHLESWIEANGRWDGFVEFSQAYFRNTKNNTVSGNSSLRSLCGYAIGAIGFITLGVCLSRR